MDKDSDNPPYLGDNLTWNSDPNWVDFVEDLTATIEAIAAKYTDDFALREDAVQNAKIELLQKYPEEVRGYEDFSRGKITLARWQEILKSYCLAVCRNEILTTLSSYTTGNAYVGRTRVVKFVSKKGKVGKKKVHEGARYVSLDTLMEDSGLQISEDGEVSWETLRELESGHGTEDT